MKKDNLWIRWVHTFYIRNRTVESSPIPKNAAWVVRKIMETRNLILELHGIHGDLVNKLVQLQKGGKFSISKLYHMQLPQLQKVLWKSITMQPHMHPRYKFILWLALQKRLATMDRLIKFGVQVSQQCVFCKQSDELFKHLFFDCPIVREIWTRLLKWLGHTRPIQAW